MLIFNLEARDKIKKSAALYPGCGTDLRPIEVLKFVDTFIYIDHRRPDNNFFNKITDLWKHSDAQFNFYYYQIELNTDKKFYREMKLTYPIETLISINFVNSKHVLGALTNYKFLVGSLHSSLDDEEYGEGEGITAHNGLNKYLKQYSRLFDNYIFIDDAKKIIFDDFYIFKQYQKTFQ